MLTTVYLESVGFKQVKNLPRFREKCYNSCLWSQKRTRKNRFADFSWSKDQECEVFKTGKGMIKKLFKISLLNSG